VKPKISFDTNLLIYAVDPHFIDKRELAQKLIGAAVYAQACIPVQVLAEFLNVNRRKGKLSHTAAADQVSHWQKTFETPQTTVAHLATGHQLAEKYQLAYFDGLICAISAASGASILLTEDMHDGLVVDGLAIINPFNSENHSRLDFLLIGKP
jgi:predicted nucleic acid-binding protein